MKYVSIIFFLLMFVIGCDNSTQPKEHSNGFYKISNDQFSLNHMHLDAYVNNPSDSMKKFILAFTEKPYSQTHGTTDAQLRFNLFSPNLAYLDSGTYILHAPKDTAMYRVAGGYLTSYTSSSNKELGGYDFVTATIIVTMVGNNYTFNMSGVLKNFKSFSAQYQGTFDSF